MKKTFQRLLAATVAIPVALTQVLAVSVNADEVENFSVTTEKLLNVEADTNIPDEISEDVTFTQESNWNETVQKALDKANGKTISVDAASIVASLGDSYYETLVKDIVGASADPSAKVTGDTITITGDADLSSYIVPDLEAKFAELGYGDITLDTTAMQLTYEIVLQADLDNKSVSGDASFTADGTPYTVETAVKYLDAIYEDLDAQVQAIVKEKVNVPGFDVEADTAALKEITDDLADKVQTLADKQSKLKTLNVAEKTYDSFDQVVDAFDYSVFANYNTVDALVAKGGSAFDKAVASLNTSLTDSDVNVSIDVSADDIATIAKGASNIVASVSNGVATVTFEIEDNEADAVEEAVKAHVVEGKTATVETTKTVTVIASAVDYSVSFDVEREVVVTLENVDETTTTNPDQTTTAPDETTTSPDETTTSPDQTTTAPDETTGGAEETTTTVNTDDTTGSDETTTSPDQTTTATDNTTGTEETTTTENTDTTGDPENPTPVIPTEGVKGVEVSLLDEEVSQGVYLSNEESFDAADLIDSVVVELENGETEEVDVSAAIGFRLTPAEAYEGVDKTTGKGTVYFKGAVEIYYTGDESIEIDVQPVVAVALKGDTDLDGDVDTDDAYENLLYFASATLGEENVAFDTVGNDDALLARLAYLVADVTTEGKLGQDDKENGIVIDTDDAYYQLVYFATTALGDEVEWADILAD
jgi:hypothetical protein